MQYFLVLMALLFFQFSKADETLSQPVLAKAEIVDFVDHYTLTGRTASAHPWTLGTEYPVVDRTDEKVILAFVHLFAIKKLGTTAYELTFKITKHLRGRFVLSGDEVLGIDLTAPPPDLYLGGTELFVKERPEVPARIKPLVYQGTVVGETAETLAQGESLASIFGFYRYGITNQASVHLWVPGLVANTYNFGAKYKFYSFDSQVLSIGFDALQLQVKNNDVVEKQTSVKASLYWDSISNSSMVSHTRLSVSALNVNSNDKNLLVNYFTSSSIQTGYEFIRWNWNRVLIGPSYNFVNKTVGGYLAYMMIWDHLHLALELDSNDINSLRYTKDVNAELGYYPSFDLFWRW